jgi:hypothetical protein
MNLSNLSHHAKVFFKKMFIQFPVISKRIVGNKLSNESYQLFGAKGFLFVQDGSKGVNVMAHNVTGISKSVNFIWLDVIYGGDGEGEIYNISLYPYREGQDKVVKGKYFTQRNTFTSTFIGAYFQYENGTSTFTLYDMSTPVKATSDWFSNIRFPM